MRRRELWVGRWEGGWVGRTGAKADGGELCLHGLHHFIHGGYVVGVAVAVVDRDGEHIVFHRGAFDFRLFG